MLFKMSKRKVLAVREKVEILAKERNYNETEKASDQKKKMYLKHRDMLVLQ